MSDQFKAAFERAKRAAESGRYPARYVKALQQIAIRVWLDTELEDE